MSETVETPQGTPQISQIEVLASGLDSPRKLSFGLNGALGGVLNLWIQQ